MNNNDTLRRLRFAFDLDDHAMMTLFKKGGYEASRADVSSWLKKDDDPELQTLKDGMLAAFLNGFIVEKRGPKEDGPEFTPEKRLNNNLVLRKLKIALALDDTAMLELFGLVGFHISKHEISAFFRKPDNARYRDCKDQILRNFLVGLQMRHRPGDGAENT